MQMREWMSGSCGGEVEVRDRLQRGTRKRLELWIHNRDCGDDLRGIHICQI